MNDQISTFIGILESECRYPRGQWHEFYSAVFPEGRETGAPVPLILAASGEAPATKLRRLKDQLISAENLGRLDIALGFLKAIPLSEWGVSNARGWRKANH